ncbi:formyltransferase family protein [uncultured Nocardioides sp.]|uniref:formyltransferase family protein n=1 Tax=uncultured Nocardioides sp. TaxID=198441 RepID=UPI00260F3811|nr:formyltransferase family protein [uncultured Nocardioides sp.]
MRIGFITCVRLGESCLEELATLGANLVYLGTLSDHIAPNKSGRVYLDDFASAHAIPLHKFRNMNDDDAVAAVRGAELDWLYVIGWSQIAKTEILGTPAKGVLGIHPTLLPVGRGRASIPWAIIKGLEETGVTMFKLDEGVDTGPILGQVQVPIEADETSGTLYNKVIEAHRTLIRETFPGVADGTIRLTAQDESQATEWPGRTPDDGELRPEQMSAAEVDRHVRALTRPYPGAFVKTSSTEKLRIWQGHIGENVAGLVIRTASGAYTATDYDVERLTAGEGCQ